MVIYQLCCLFNKKKESKEAILLRYRYHQETIYDRFMIDTSEANFFWVAVHTDGGAYLLIKYWFTCYWQWTYTIFNNKSIHFFFSRTDVSNLVKRSIAPSSWKHPVAGSPCDIRPQGTTKGCNPSGVGLIFTHTRSHRRRHPHNPVPD